MTKIKFGTDGWRAIMNEDYTHGNVAKVIQAFCDVKNKEPNKNVYVGYDRRKDSAEFAKTVADVLASNGFTAWLSNDFCPTPCISWMTKVKQGLAGIMITASHNPAQWNGVKFKEGYGGSASPEYTQEIEDQIVVNDTAGKTPLQNGFEQGVTNGQIQKFDPKDTYVKHLQQFVDIKIIQQSGIRIAYDAMYGAGSHFLAQVLGMPVLALHAEADPTFGGTNPEPIEKNLQEVTQVLKAKNADVALATDGDADRIGAIDENGTYVSTNQIFALLLKHHFTHRHAKGSIVMSVSTTSMIRKMCTQYGLNLIETPVGFKHICKYLKNENALMGGEESGGFSYRDHVHERDGIFNGLMILEMMAIHKKSLSQLVQDLTTEFGSYFYERIDYHLTPEKIERAKAIAAKHDITSIGGVAVTNYSTMDGVKIFFADGSWLLLRSSGTEPLLRTYAEGSTIERVKEILTFAKTHLQLN